MCLPNIAEGLLLQSATAGIGVVFNQQLTSINEYHISVIAPSAKTNLMHGVDTGVTQSEILAMLWDSFILTPENTKPLFTADHNDFGTTSGTVTVSY